MNQPLAALGVILIRLTMPKIVSSRVSCPPTEFEELDWFILAELNGCVKSLHASSQQRFLSTPRNLPALLAWCLGFKKKWSP